MILDVAIIGSGFGGLAAALRLRAAGIEDFAIFERANDLGGTWRDNTYPGCRCDVASDLYSLSSAPNPAWSNTYSYQPEIWAYLESVATENRLRETIRFEHDVESLEFDDASRRWRLNTSRGEFEARAVVLATGPLAEPRWPEFEGIDSFDGAIMHTARWNSDVSLEGKRVAVIGTGASAVQAVPQIASIASHLDLFQRTPVWVLPHLGHPVREGTRQLFRRVPLAQRLVRYWTYWRRELMVLGFVKDPERMTKAETMAKDFLAHQIHDPALRAKLTPRYRLGCKRVTISNDFYPTLARENVEVVTEGIARIEPRGLVSVDGVLHEADVIVMATGFLVTDNPIGQRVRARGRVLADAFEGGLANYKGTTFPDFPNLFMLSGPNTGLGHSSIVFMEESQLNYVIGALRVVLSSNALVAPTAHAAEVWTRALQAKMPGTVWGSGCASWYLNRHGENTTIWPDFTFTFRRATRRFVRADHVISY